MSGVFCFCSQRLAGPGRKNLERIDPAALWPCSSGLPSSCSRCCALLRPPRSYCVSVRGRVAPSRVPAEGADLGRSALIPGADQAAGHRTAAAATATPAMPPVHRDPIRARRPAQPRHPVGGMLGAGGANTLNCVADADIDKVMKRTARRPLDQEVVPTSKRIRVRTCARPRFVLLAVADDQPPVRPAPSLRSRSTSSSTRWFSNVAPRKTSCGGAQRAVCPTS